MSDVYTGYGRTVREVNARRRETGAPEIVALFCNAHSRRKFAEACLDHDEAQYFIEQYELIYRIESELKRIEDTDSCMSKRSAQRSYFEKMLVQGQKLSHQYPDKSSMNKAISYFTNNYMGLTRFLENPDLPIDNNLAERQLRSPVVGRKTWYGTHSPRGAKTTEILFSIMQTCKNLKIDPHDYLTAVTNAMLNKKPPFTPAQFLAELPDKKIV